MPKVSVVIPTKNSAKYLEKCLRSISELDFPKEELEVIIVDGGSTDGTIEIAKKYGCKVIIENGGTIGYARDLGMRAASGEFVAYTDADCVVDRNWLKELLSRFMDESIAAVGGPNVTPGDDSDFGKAVGDVLELLSRAGARYMFNADRVIEVYHNPTCNSIYRKKALEEAGGFNYKLITVDDEELDYRIRKRGYRILFNPRAVVYHYRKGSWRSFAKMAYSYGIGRMQAVKLHRDMGKWFHYAAMGFIALIPLLPISPLISRAFFMLVSAALSFALLAMLGASIHLSLKKGRSPLLYFGLILAWVTVYGLGMWRGLTK